MRQNRKKDPLAHVPPLLVRQKLGRCGAKALDFGGTAGKNVGHNVPGQSLLRLPLRIDRPPPGMAWMLL